MQSSVYATCTDWNFFSGNPLFIAARCRFTFTYSTVPVGGFLSIFYHAAKRAIGAGKPISDQGYLLRSTGLVYTRWTAIYVLQKKQQARRSSARGKLESEKVGLPWAWPGVLEGTYDPCFNQIHARNNIIKHSNNVSFHVKVLFNIVNNKSTFVNNISHFYGRIIGDFG